MSAPLVDTHCHLDVEHYDTDRDAVVRRAAEKGINRIVVPAVDIASCARVTALTRRYPNVFAAVGIHPIEIPSGVPIDEARLQIREAAQNSHIVAIGEIGLDYHWKNAPHEAQHEWLRMQLELASELELPVILHNRESTGDIMEIVCDWAEHELPPSLVGRPGVLHSVSAGWADVEVALQHGFFLGFTGPLTYKNAEEMREVARRAPDDRILVETDGPYLSPLPHRGERNEPAFVLLTVEKLAQVRAVSFEQICDQTTANACRLFGLPQDEHAA